MNQSIWNSPAAVVRTGDGALASSTAVGRLHEMVDYLLSWPVELREGLRLESDAFEDPLGPDEAAALRRRGDFPLIC